MQNIRTALLISALISLACLEIRSEMRGDNSTQNRIYSLFIYIVFNDLFLNDLATTGYTSAVAGYTLVQLHEIQGWAST